MRVAVTGISSDFGTVIAPLLFADPDVDQVVGVDLREPRVADSKLVFEREDVRSSRIGDLFAGCDAVVHLAFVVQEIRDKQLTHAINLAGSKNVIERAHDAGVHRLVIASSVAAYGVHPDLPVPITEDEFPRGNPDKYYFYDKAEVEHYIDWWERRHPQSSMSIARIRPPFIVGPHFDNPALDNFSARSTVVPAGSAGGIQLLWETDLARAFQLALGSDVSGPFNVGTPDSLTARDVADIHGQRLRELPVRIAAPLADVLFRLRLAPVSSHWVISGEGVVSARRIEQELGWSPQFSSAESARMLLVQRGRPLLPGRSADVFARKQVAEEALRPITERLRSWSRSVPGLRSALDGADHLDRIVERVEHVLLSHRDKRLHLEVQEAEPGAATIVFSPGLGAYGRFYLPLLGRLCEEGFNVVAVDRPGHGLSEGRRGDCTIGETLDVVEDAVRYARERFGGPVALLGSSLGGIISWYALTREPDVEAVVCHNIAHPAVMHEPAMRVKVPLLRRLARLAPLAPVPIEQIADFAKLSVSPEILDFARREQDGIWCWRVSARSVASLFDYEPPLDWTRVETPVLALVGAGDEMVSPEFSRAAVAAARPPRSELRVLPDCGHLLFHDHLADVLPLLVEWLGGNLAQAAGPAATEEAAGAR